MAEAAETTKERVEAEAGGGIAVFFSPEAMIMLPLAALLDLVGIILVCFALDDFWITDILGIASIGLWTYFRSQTMKVTHGASAKITKAAKWAKRLKWLRPLLIVCEFIPYVGAAPLWVIVVYLELRYSQT